jgi:hypothetical protein
MVTAIPRKGSSITHVAQNPHPFIIPSSSRNPPHAIAGRLPFFCSSSAASTARDRSFPFPFLSITSYRLTISPSPSLSCQFGSPSPLCPPSLQSIPTMSTSSLTDLVLTSILSFAVASISTTSTTSIPLPLSPSLFNTPPVRCQSASPIRDHIDPYSRLTLPRPEHLSHACPLSFRLIHRAHDAGPS